MQYLLNEAVGRPFDSTVNVARMMCRSSKTCFRVRLSANWCSGGTVTEYSD